MLQTIIKENDIDLNGYLSFNEFLVAMSTNFATIPGDEQRFEYLYSHFTLVCTYVYLRSQRLHERKEHLVLNNLVTMI